MRGKTGGGGWEEEMIGVGGMIYRGELQGDGALGFEVEGHSGGDATVKRR